MRYAALSLILASILLFSTGCTALLLGDDRTAYNLILEASEYFKDPSSVQIVSGEVYDGSMFCVLKAKNSYGTYRSDTYFFSESGYPLEHYSEYCYSDSLNYDLINNSLAFHYGVAPSSGIISRVIGGNHMSSEVTVFVYIVILVVALCLNGYLASNASDIAEEKGYEKRKWFHMCFWMGPVPYIIIAAMPDHRMLSLMENVVKIQQETMDKLNGTVGGQDSPAKASYFDDLPSL